MTSFLQLILNQTSSRSRDARTGAKLTLFIETLADWRDYSKWHSLYDLIWKIYDDRFYYDYVGSLPRAEQRQANLYALALRANAYEKTGFKGLSRFIGMIDKIISSGRLEEVQIGS